MRCEDLLPRSSTRELNCTIVHAYKGVDNGVKSSMVFPISKIFLERDYKAAIGDGWSKLYLPLQRIQEDGKEGELYHETDFIKS